MGASYIRICARKSPPQGAASAQPLSHVIPLRHVPRPLVQGPCPVVRCRDLELDLRVPAGPRPSLRLPEEEPRDPRAAVLRGHPDVVHEPDAPRGEERLQFAEDDVPEEAARGVLRDATRRPLRLPQLAPAT